MISKHIRLQYSRRLALILGQYIPKYLMHRPNLSDTGFEYYALNHIWLDGAGELWSKVREEFLRLQGKGKPVLQAIYIPSRI